MEDEGVGDDEVTEAGRPAPRWLMRLAVLIAAVGVVVLVVGGSMWWRAAHDDGLDLARGRDAALIDAKRDVAVLTTLDHREVDAGLERWLAVSTGPLREQLATVDAEARQTLADAGKVTTGTVVDAALTDLDLRAGTASGIATVEISVGGDTGEPTVKRDRFAVDLERVGGRWLVSALDQVEVELE